MEGVNVLVLYTGIYEDICGEVGSAFVVPMTVAFGSFAELKLLKVSLEVMDVLLLLLLLLLLMSISLGSFKFKLTAGFTLIIFVFNMGFKMDFCVCFIGSGNVCVPSVLFNKEDLVVVRSSCSGSVCRGRCCSGSNMVCLSFMVIVFFDFIAIVVALSSYSFSSSSSSSSSLSSLSLCKLDGW